MSAGRALAVACLAATAVASGFGIAVAVMARRTLQEPAAPREDLEHSLWRLAEQVRQLDHDLRTPIGTVEAALEILRTSAERDPALRDETLQLMSRQVARLKVLVHGVHALATDVAGDDMASKQTREDAGRGVEAAVARVQGMP